MSDTITQTRVADLVRERPTRARFFEDRQIDYCCHGRQTLVEACAGRKLNAEQVAADLAAYDERPATGEHDVDWRARPIGELIDHIVDVHHAYLRRELPRLSMLMDKVLAAHRERHPELAELQVVLGAVRAELETHMQKEERVLFPWIRQFGDGEAEHTGCSVSQPILVMEDEHRSVAVGLDRMRWLTHDYQPPDDACPTFRALVSGLAEMAADLHLHIHEENNVLFPWALELEALAV